LYTHEGAGDGDMLCWSWVYNRAKVTSAQVFKNAECQTAPLLFPGSVQIVPQKWQSQKLEWK